MTMTLICLSFATLLVFLFIFQRSFDRDKRLIGLSLLLMILSGRSSLKIGSRLGSVVIACMTYTWEYQWKQNKSNVFFF